MKGKLDAVKIIVGFTLQLRKKCGGWYMVNKLGWNIIFEIGETG